VTTARTRSRVRVNPDKKCIINTNTRDNRSYPLDQGGDVGPSLRDEQTFVIKDTELLLIIVMVVTHPLNQRRDVCPSLGAKQAFMTNMQNQYS